VKASSAWSLRLKNNKRAEDKPLIKILPNYIFINKNKNSKNLRKKKKKNPAQPRNQFESFKKYVPSLSLSLTFTFAFHSSLAVKTEAHDRCLAFL
jgi:hypothetical protein